MSADEPFVCHHRSAAQLSGEFEHYWLDQRPAVKNLAQIIKEWLRYRLDVVTRRLNFRLDKINDRLHILDGLLVAYLNLMK